MLGLAQKSHPQVFIRLDFPATGDRLCPQGCCVVTLLATAITQQLGQEFKGVISSDDYSVYNGYSVEAQQKCLAHLRRHFKKVIKLGYGNNPALGQAFLDLIDVGEAFPKGSFCSTSPMAAD